MAKIKWRVSESPAGMYRSFFKRAWPSAEINGRVAFCIRCEDSYVPRDARGGNHSELKLLVADHREKEVGFTWKTFKKRFSTLQEAKEFAQSFAENNPEFFENKVG